VGAVPLEGLGVITLAVLVGEVVLAPPWGAVFVTPMTIHMLDSNLGLGLVYDLLEAINPATPFELELAAVATAL
jgi:hypothetical protein